MPAALATFVVVNWNGKHLLEQSIPSILGQTYAEVEVIVVDNGSSDGSVEYLRRFPEVRVIELPENRGYGEPSNLAFEKARGEWIATVNNDMVLDPDWLRHLVSAIESDPACFSVQGRNLKQGESGVIDGCGIGLRPCGAALRLYHNQSDAPSAGEPTPIFAASSGAAVYRKRMLAEIGYFDTSYFIYYEDLDAGWRARLKGWHSKMVPQAVASHRVHATSRAGGGELLWYLGERNRLRTLVKNLPLGAVLRHPFLIGLDELRYLNLVRKNVKARTLVEARVEVMREIISLWRKRPADLKNRGAREWLEWLAL